MTAGVFFHRLATASHLACPVNLDLTCQELPPPPGDSLRMHAQQPRDPCIATEAVLERFDSRVQAPLFLVEQAEEDDNGGLRRAGKLLLRQIHEVARHQLLLAGRGLRRAIEVPIGHFFSCNLSLGNQSQQRFLDADTQQLPELIGEIAAMRRVHEMLQGRHQCTALGKTYIVVRPQTTMVELGKLIQRVVAATVRVA